MSDPRTASAHIHSEHAGEHSSAARIYGRTCSSSLHQPICCHGITLLARGALSTLPPLSLSYPLPSLLSFTLRVSVIRPIGSLKSVLRVEAAAAPLPAAVGRRRLRLESGAAQSALRQRFNHLNLLSSL